MINLFSSMLQPPFISLQLVEGGKRTCNGNIKEFKVVTGENCERKKKDQSTKSIHKNCFSLFQGTSSMPPKSMTFRKGASTSQKYKGVKQNSETILILYFKNVSNSISLLWVFDFSRYFL